MPHFIMDVETFVETPIVQISDISVMVSGPLPNQRDKLCSWAKISLHF